MARIQALNAVIKLAQTQPLAACNSQKMAALVASGSIGQRLISRARSGSMGSRLLDSDAPIQPIDGAQKQSALITQGQSLQRSTDQASRVSMILALKRLRQGR
jgi:hypothetical protein